MKKVKWNIKLELLFFISNCVYFSTPFTLQKYFENTENLSFFLFLNAWTFKLCLFWLPNMCVMFRCFFYITHIPCELFVSASCSSPIFLCYRVSLPLLTRFIVFFCDTHLAKFLSLKLIYCWKLLLCGLHIPW